MNLLRELFLLNIFFTYLTLVGMVFIEFSLKEQFHFISFALEKFLKHFSGVDRGSENDLKYCLFFNHLMVSNNRHFLYQVDEAKAFSKNRTFNS